MTEAETKLKAIEKRLQEYGDVITQEELEASWKTVKELTEQIAAEREKRFVRALNEEICYLPSHRRNEVHPLFNINVV
jgi:hypothetical protein